MHPFALAVSALSAALVGAYYSNTLLGVIGVALGALALLQHRSLGGSLFGGLIVDISNKVEAYASTQKKSDGSKEWYYVATYHLPRNFNKFVFKYPRNETCYQSYRVTVTYNKSSVDSGRRTDIGLPSSDNQNELTLVERYTKTGSQWIERVTVQFFQTPSSNADVNQCFADRFKKLLQKGSFYYYSQEKPGGPPVPIQTIAPTAAIWHADPAMFID